ncbi:hypothetical protein D9M68_897110 [compost metagenome]
MAFASTRVPAPVLISWPLPLTVPPRVSVLSAAVCRVPLPASAILRALLTSALVANAPPLKASVLLASPRLASSEICSVPPLSVVPPV